MTSAWYPLARKVVTDYQRLFQFDGFVPFFISCEFVEAYRDLSALAYGDKNAWMSYMPITSVKQTLLDGLALYKSIKRYNAYKRKLDYTFRKISEMSKKVRRIALTKRLAVDYLSLLKQYRILYQKLEFFYTDLAFEKRAEFPSIKRNFKSFAQLKLKGRTYLNKIYFTPDSYSVNFLKKISSQFQVPYKYLVHYSLEEILAVFDGARVNKGIIAKRKRFYVVYVLNKRMYSIAGEEAVSFIKSVRAHDQSNITELKGQIAQRGKAIGKAKVITVNLNRYDKVAQFIDEMKQGQILVAETTEPSIIMACKKASAIVTNQGGMMSHAAIVAREMGIPCVVGTKIATKVFKDGDLIEVDADKGVVRKIL